MTLEQPEIIIRTAGGLLAYGVLVTLLLGIWRGLQRQPGRTSGLTGAWQRSGWFYGLAALIFFGMSAAGWKTLPLSFSPQAHAWMLVIGALCYLPGMAFVLWGRLALGKDYYVSTGLGAQLFTGQRLVTQGPFGVVRHPMYLGVILSAFGSLLIYHTWTSLFYAICAPFILARARREERVLEAEFGDAWLDYCHQVPMIVPGLTLLKDGRTSLTLAAGGSFAVSLVHLIAILVGPAAYRLLGAGEDMAEMAETGSPLPALLTGGLAAVFVIFGCYALSGAGVVKRLFLLPIALIGIAGLYTLRGAALFCETGMVLTSQLPLNSLSLFYSSISLAIGLIHFAGIKAHWNYLHVNPGE